MELFYYTSTDTMRYVLTQGDIYATNIRYMNDSEEYINGLRELYQLSQKRQLVKRWAEKRGFDESLLDKIQNIFTESNLNDNMKHMEYYSISFCKKNDLLSQWAIYARESGVSIKMNFEESEYRFSTKSIYEQSDKNNQGNDNNKVDKKAEWNLCPQEIYYFTYDSMEKQSDQYEATAFTILDKLYELSSKEQEEWKKERWRYISTLVKRYDFYQEEECRLVFDPNASANPPCVQYRMDKKVLKPYLDIECDKGWPVWEIMIGPGFNQQLVYDSVEHLLNHADVKVGCETIQEYAKRIEQYLEPVKNELSKYNQYKEVQHQLQRCGKMEEDDEEKDNAIILLNQKLHEMQQLVLECTGGDEELKQYFTNNHFTKSGVVLTKSSIPYIF